MQVLLEVHGFEVFCTPIFNADPHPGNIKVMSDGRLGLIDYGQCKRIEPSERLAIAHFVLAIAEARPRKEIADALRGCGMTTKHDSDEFLADFGGLLFGKLEQKHMQREWHMRLHKADSIVLFPPSLIMLYRMATILRGLALTLRYNVSVAEHWAASAAAAVAAGGTVSPEVKPRRGAAGDTDHYSLR